MEMGTFNNSISSTLYMEKYSVPHALNGWLQINDIQCNYYIDQFSETERSVCDEDSQKMYVFFINSGSYFWYLRWNRV